MQPVLLTGTSTYARKSWGGLTRCDLAPLTTSFGTVGQWERQHWQWLLRQALKSWGGLPRCDLAPQSTSFGTLALRERQHLAMAGSRHLYSPRYATAHCAARANHHVPHCSVLAEVDVQTCRLLTTGTVTRCIRCMRRGYVRLRFLGTSTQPGCTVLGPYCLFRDFLHSLVVIASQIAVYHSPVPQHFEGGNSAPGAPGSDLASWRARPDRKEFWHFFPVLMVSLYCFPMKSEFHVFVLVQENLADDVSRGQYHACPNGALLWRETHGKSAWWHSHLFNCCQRFEELFGVSSSSTVWCRVLGLVGWLQQWSS